MRGSAQVPGLKASVLRMRAAVDRKALAFAELALDDVVAMAACLDRLAAPPRERNLAFSQLYGMLTALRRNAVTCGFSLVGDICALCRDVLDDAPDDRSEVAVRLRPCLDEMQRLLELCVSGSGGPEGAALLAHLRAGEA